MSEYLLLFTITPVQSFISQARKTQDLYAGSRILSQLIEEVRGKVVNEFKGEIVFPLNKSEENQGVNTYDRASSNPNRFVARIQTDDPQAAGASLEKQVQNSFKEMAQKAFKAVCQTETPVSSFYEQVENFWQVYWVMIPLNRENQHYKGSYSNLEMYLGGMKNIRSFRQLLESGHRKCSICGEHNALFYGPDLDKPEGRQAPAFTSLEALPITSLQVSPGEGLCAICLVKRFWSGETGEFPSTATVTLMPLLHSLKVDKDAKSLFEAYRHTINCTCCTRHQFSLYNDQLLFQDNLNPAYFKKNGLLMGVAKDTETVKAAIINSFNSLQSYIKEKQKQETQIEDSQKETLRYWSQPSYYAVMAFDGDSMGEWLSGVKLGDDVSLEDFHKELSTCLNQFASLVKECFIDPTKTNLDKQEHKYFGRVVYAGGEDFLGFVPLEHAFTSLERLRNIFEETVNRPIQNKFFPGNYKADKGHTEMSFSAGMVISHYKYPLSETLKWVRRMEHSAKAVDGKNALGIALIKHSGEVEESVYKWHLTSKSQLDQQHISMVTEIFGEIKQAIESGEFSGRFIKNLNAEFRLLTGRTRGEISMKDGDEMICCEIKRLINRACNMLPYPDDNQEEHQQIKKAAIDRLSEAVYCLYQNREDNLDNFISALNIIHFLTREVAGGVD